MNGPRIGQSIDFYRFQLGKPRIAQLDSCIRQAHLEKYPDNQLPYVDDLVALHMKEEATYIAALRTGQVDMLTTPYYVARPRAG